MSNPKDDNSREPLYEFIAELHRFSEPPTANGHQWVFWPRRFGGYCLVCGRGQHVGASWYSPPTRALFKCLRCNLILCRYKHEFEPCISLLRKKAVECPEDDARGAKEHKRKWVLKEEPHDD